MSSWLLDLNYEKLTPHKIKETSSYLQLRCPVCGSESPGVKIAKGKGIRGAYKCYSNYCSNSKIREALGIEKETNYFLSPYKPRLLKSVYSKDIDLKNIKARTSLFSPKLISCYGYDAITSATRSFANTEKRVTVYDYSETQRVYRLDDPNNVEKKKIYLQHFTGEGLWEAGTGSRLWQAYLRGIEHFLSNPQEGQNTLLWVEGEKCAESLKTKGISAFTVASPFYNPASLEKILYVLFSNYPAIENVIAVPDEDEPGYHKAELVSKIAHSLKKNSVVQPLSEILGLSEKPEKGSDLADFDFVQEDLVLLGATPFQQKNNK